MLETVYRNLLKLYPRPFQDEYGNAMIAVFREDRHALRHFADLFISIPGEWLSGTGKACEDALRLPPELASEIADEQTRRNAAAPIIALVLSFTVVSFAGWLTWGPYVYFLHVSVCAVLMRVVRYRTRRYWHSFGVRMDHEALTVYSSEGQQRIRRASISEIIEAPLRGLTISRRGKRDVWIPRSLTGYEDLRRQLAEWHRLDVIPDNEGRILKI